MNPKDTLEYDDNYLLICREIEYRSLVMRAGISPEEARNFLKTVDKVSPGGGSILPIDQSLKRMADAMCVNLIADDTTREKMVETISNSMEDFLHSVNYSNYDEDGNQLPCPSFKNARNTLAKRVLAYMQTLFPKPILEDF